MRLECSECGLEVPSNASGCWAHCPLCVVKESINRYQDSHTAHKNTRKRRLNDVTYQLSMATLWIGQYYKEILE